MTRYSRSVIPGRGLPEGREAALDSMVFGAKRKSPPANDPGEPDFAPMDDDDVDFVMARSNADRRKTPDRRQGPADRRQSNGRRAAEYAPLRDGGYDRSGEDSRRGPMLLIGALIIVAVFGVVVWNAYSDGVQTDEVEVAPELSTAGAFKTPPRAVPDAPVVTEPVNVAEGRSDPLAGTPIDITGEQRPVASPPAKVEPTKVETAAEPPAVSKVTAAPPPTLKAPPAQTGSTQTAAAQPVAKPVAAAPAPAVAGGYRPNFAANGDHVVQIAATSSEATAEAEWGKLQRLHADLLSSAERFIQQADVNGRTVYRLRVGSFASKADAAAFCSAFKARGGNCYPAVK